VGADGDTRLGRIWPDDVPLPACVGTDEIVGMSLSRLDGEIYAIVDYQAGASPGDVGRWHVRLTGPDLYLPRTYLCALPAIGFQGSCDLDQHPNAGWGGLETSPRMEARQVWAACKDWGQALHTLRARREATIDQREIDERNAAWDRTMAEADRAEIRGMTQTAIAIINRFISQSVDAAIVRARPYMWWVLGGAALLGLTWWGVTRGND
jgi:hypothetical protein